MLLFNTIQNPALWPTSECPLEVAVYRIGRTMFETDRIPTGWAKRCNKMNEIWVPTQFHREIFAQNGVDSSKIHVIPEAVDTELFDPRVVAPLELNQSELESFRFFSVFKVGLCKSFCARC